MRSLRDAFEIFQGTRVLVSQGSFYSQSGNPAPSCFPGVGLGSFYYQSIQVDCKSTATQSTLGTLSASLSLLLRLLPCAHPSPRPARFPVGFIVVLSVGLAVLIVYWVWQDRVAKKKVVDTSGTVAHYQALEAAEAAGH